MVEPELSLGWVYLSTSLNVFLKATLLPSVILRISEPPLSKFSLLSPQLTLKILELSGKKEKEKIKIKFKLYTKNAGSKLKDSMKRVFFWLKYNIAHFMKKTMNKNPNSKGFTCYWGLPQSSPNNSFSILNTSNNITLSSKSFDGHPTKCS